MVNSTCGHLHILTNVNDSQHLSCICYFKFYILLKPSPLPPLAPTVVDGNVAFTPYIYFMSNCLFGGSNYTIVLGEHQSSSPS